MDGGQRLPSDAGDVQSDAQPMAAGNGGGGNNTGGAGGSAGRAAGAGGGGGRVSDDASVEEPVQDAGEAGSGGAGSGGAGGSSAGSGGTGGSEGRDPDADWTAECLKKSGVLLCNGFESAPFEDQWPYEIIENGIGELSTMPKHSGVGALRASTYSAQQGTAVRYATRVLNEKKSGDIWSRYYYYLPSSTQITTWISSGVMSEIDEPWQGFSLLIHDNYVEIESMLGYFDDGVAFPRDRWVCVELFARIGENGYFQAFLDGMSAARTGSGSTVPATGFTAAEFGIHYAEYRQGSVVVYVDDVAVGTERIGCD